MKKLFFAVMLFCFTVSHAQIVFEKGYFINNSGMRIECYIENVDWNNNPKTFTYKLLENDQPKIETYMGVREFGIDNVSMFKRFTVNMEHSRFETGLLAQSKVPAFKEETLFLKAVVTGDANLYVWSGENIVKYFYETKANAIQQLIYIRYLQNGYEILENNQFRQQLLNDLKCGDITEKDFKNLTYNENALSKIFVKYNNCAGTTANSTVNFAEKNNGKSLSLKITPGVYMASLSISDPSTIYDASTDQHGMVFKIGVELEYMLPFNKNTWSIFLNPTYQKFKEENTYIKADLINHNSYLTYTAQTEYTSAEVPIGLRRYFFLNSNSKIFVNVAYVIDLVVGDSNIDLINVEKINANKHVDIGSRNNFAAGIGFAYKKFTAEARINTVREIAGGYINWHAKYTSTGITLGYAIF